MAAVVALFVLILVVICNCNDIPVIGVIPQPCMYNGVNLCRNMSPMKNPKSYVPASYVQWIQMSGAEIIPLYFSYNQANLSQILPQINGVMICGGAASTDPKSSYEQFIQSVMSMSREFHLNSKNMAQSLPIWGTCDGFENMMTAVAKGGESVMGNFDASSLNLPVIYNETNIGESVMFNMDNKQSIYYGLNELVMNLTSNKNITYNDHNNGITPTVFYGDEYVRSNFTNLGTSFDRNSQEFVTLVESRKELGLNWYASQFHPEKSSFEFSRNGIVHTYDAVLSNAWFSNFFTNRCRMANGNTMNSKLFNELVIYNYNPVWTDNQNFEQVYVFQQ